MENASWFDKALDVIRGTKKETMTFAGNEAVVLKKGEDEVLCFVEPSKKVYETIQCEDAETLLGYISEFNTRFSETPIDDLNIFISNGEIKKVLLRETAKTKCVNSYCLEIETHDDFNEWFDGRIMGQGMFRDFLMRHAGQHDAPNLASILEVFRGKIEIDFAASTQTARNYELVWVEKETASKSEIPTIINAEFPLMNGFDYNVRVAFDVILDMPKAPGEKLSFRLLPRGTNQSATYKEHCKPAVQTCLLDKINEMNKDLVNPIRCPKFIRHSVVSEDLPTSVVIKNL